MSDVYVFLDFSGYPYYGTGYDESYIEACIIGGEFFGVFDNADDYADELGKLGFPEEEVLVEKRVFEMVAMGVNRVL